MRHILQAIVACFILLSCSEDPAAPPPHVTATFLEVASTDYTSLTLKLRTTELREGATHRLTRDGMQVWEGVLTGDDTLITDTGLTASSGYRYKAYALQHGSVYDSSEAVLAHTRDTTSGDFTWEVTVLGDYPSLLRDVYMISSTDVWAVGKVTHFAPDTRNGYIIYNALHWDGVKWDTLQVPTTESLPGGIQRRWFEEEMFTVYAAQKNDVWFLGQSNGVCRWKNGEWLEMKPPFAEGPGGRANAAWGTSTDLIIASWSAGIKHWDGNAFESVLHRTDIGGVYAQDVWGVEDTALVIAGDRDYQLETQVYQVVNGIAKPFPTTGMRRGMVTLWFANQNVIFAGGSTQSTYKNGQWYNDPINPDLGFINHIRGVAENDVFAVGYFSTVLHFSGLQWQAYPAIDLERKYDFYAVAYDGSHVFAVGEDTAGKAIILHGRRK